MLDDYANGVNPRFDPAMLFLPPFDTSEELELYLKLEVQYVESLYHLALLLMLPADVIGDLPVPARCAITRGSKVMRSDRFKLLRLTAALLPLVDSKPSDLSPFLTDCWERLNEPEMIEAWHFSKFDVLYSTWIVFNPAYLGRQDLRIPDRNDAALSSDVQQPLRFENILMNYSFSGNDNVHNARELYEYQFNSLKGSVNELLASAPTAAERRESLVSYQRRLANAARVVARARRFYEWLPHEITAHNAEHEYVRELAKLGRMSDELGEVRAHHRTYGE
jgi:hypothetical protein